MMTLETRSGQSLQTSNGKLVGYAAVFNAPSHDLGGFREVIKPGAFKRTLADSGHIRALCNHDNGQLLGKVSAGTLVLSEDEIGLRFEVELPQTSYARDLSELVSRGDISGCSFGFRVRAGGELWEESNGANDPRLTALDLGEISIVSNPAYESTEVAKRNRPMTQGFVDLNRKWLETV
jgi:HK97 family phage prohead protease